MKKILPIIIAVIVTGSIAFYGGMKYGQSQTAIVANGVSRGANSFANLTTEQRQQMFSGQGDQQNGAARKINNANGANMAAGQIIAKDAQSVTIKLRDGGSKIVFFSDSTKITKSTDGAIGDLEIGRTVMAGGKQNSDGSLTAETLQINNK